MPPKTRQSRPATRLEVTATDRLTPGMVRVHLRSADLSAFAESVHTDRYVKLVFPRPGVVYPGFDSGPFDMAEVRRTMPPEQLPLVRTYTALTPDVDAGTMAIDFVVHGDEGVAGPWAAQAAPGDALLLNGPGGAYAPDLEADWYLLAGDEAGLPAIRAAVEALPASAVGYVVVEVRDSEHEQPLAAPDGVEVRWLHTGEEPALVDAVRALPWRDGRLDAFVHGEAESVMHGIRPYLLREREVPKGQVSISGYWRQGRTEEGFRQWKSALAQEEAQTEVAPAS